MEQKKITFTLKYIRLDIENREIAEELSRATRELDDGNERYAAASTVSHI